MYEQGGVGDEELRRLGDLLDAVGVPGRQAVGQEDVLEQREVAIERGPRDADRAAHVRLVQRSADTRGERGEHGWDLGETLDVRLLAQVALHDHSEIRGEPLLAALVFATCQRLSVR